jgi:hypothetical protein
VDNDLEKGKNLKLILSFFEYLSGLNKLPSKCIVLFRHGAAQDEATLYTEIFSNGQGHFPISYLGILNHYWTITNADYKHVEERLQKLLSS